MKNISISLLIIISDEFLFIISSINSFLEIFPVFDLSNIFKINFEVSSLIFSIFIEFKFFINCVISLISNISFVKLNL